MISDNSTVANISSDQLWWLVMDRQYASDDQREQVIADQGLREQKWLPTRDLPRERVGTAIRAATHDLSLSIYSGWSRDFLGSEDERNTFITILNRWEIGAEIQASDYKDAHVQWLATPQPYTHAAFIKIRDGLVIPQDYPRREINRPPRDDYPAPPAPKDDGPKDEPKRPALKRVPVSVQQDTNREIVDEHPAWSAKEINAEANRRLERAGYDQETYALPGVSATEKNLAKDPLIVENREAGRFVWHRAWCSVPPERARIHGEAPERFCAICGADISRKRADSLTCSPACKKRHQRRH